MGAFDVSSVQVFIKFDDIRHGNLEGLLQTLPIQSGSEGPLSFLSPGVQRSREIQEQIKVVVIRELPTSLSTGGRKRHFYYRSSCLFASTIARAE